MPDAKLRLPAGAYELGTDPAFHTIETPFAKVLLETTYVRPGTSAVTGIREAVELTLGDPSLEAIDVTEGWLDLPGWASGSGARATLANTSVDPPVRVGSVGYQAYPDGQADLFLVTTRNPEDPDPVSTSDHALDSLAWGLCDRAAPFPDNCSPFEDDRASTLPPRPSEPEGPPHATPRPRSTNERRSPAALRRELKLSASPLSCSDWTGRQADFDPFEDGSRAAIMCEDPRPGVDFMALYRFDDAQSLDRYWTKRVKAAERKVSLIWHPSTCRDGFKGLQGWDYGELFCYLSDETALLRWTDERTNTYGIINSVPGRTSLELLFAKWREVRP